MMSRLSILSVPLSIVSLLVLAACGSVVTSGGDNVEGTGGSSDPTTTTGETTGEGATTTTATTGTGAGGAGAGGGTSTSGTGAGGGEPVDFGPASCDSNIVLDEADPYNAAKAIELCKKANGGNDWGVLDAKWVLPDGSPIPVGSEVNYHLGHGVYDGYGPNVAVRKGDRMLGLSNGVARRPTDPDYQPPQGGFSKNYSNNAPAGFPKASPACPGVTPGTAYDGVALEVTIRSPNAAHSFSFDLNYFTAEYPEWVCTTFNDTFAALLSPTPAGQVDGNISYDSMGNVISVNNVFFEVCPGCNLGTTGLDGTGYDNDNGGATGWLTTSAPVNGGDTITLRWTTWDSGDGILDSGTLVDNFKWTVQPNMIVSTTRATQ